MFMILLAMSTSYYDYSTGHYLHSSVCVSVLFEQIQHHLWKVTVIMTQKKVPDEKNAEWF